MVFHVATHKKKNKETLLVYMCIIGDTGIIGMDIEMSITKCKTSKNNGCFLVSTQWLVWIVSIWYFGILLIEIWEFWDSYSWEVVVMKASFLWILLQFMFSWYLIAVLWFIFFLLFPVDRSYLYWFLEFDLFWSMGGPTPN